MSSAAVVQGQKYQTMVCGIGAASREEDNIFIPTYNLNISGNGKVDKMENHFQTLAAYKAERLALDKINKEAPRDASGDFTESLASMGAAIDRATEEADKTAFTLVQIPKETVDRNKGLYERSVDGSSPQGQSLALTREIAQIIRDSGLFRE